MPKFMATHTLPPQSLTRQQVEQVSQAMQTDPQVHGLRSFLNLSQGRIVCIVEAPDRQTLAGWYNKMNLPYDSIDAVEFEGDRGRITDVRTTIPTPSTSTGASAGLHS